MQTGQPKRYLPSPSGTHTENSWSQICIHNHSKRWL